MREDDSIKLIPIGGLGEIGKNMMLLEYHEKIIIIDAGMMFPDYQVHGIDFIIPDVSYVLENRKRVIAIILTHGHEDHIGALPYLLREIHAPVYGTKLTLGFAKNRLEEHAFVQRPELIEIHPRQTVQFGEVSAEFFRVCHSIADGVGIAFHTPQGIILHSGDFKVDFTPVDGNYLDFQKLAELGEKGIHVLLSDSTNAENEGYTPSESKLSEALFETIAGAEGRVLVATFASNIHRIQQVFDICQHENKKVAILGMSMEKNITMAKSLGYLTFDESNIISPEKVNSYKRSRVVIITTGSQGEPMSALARIAHKQFKSFEIERGDTVILSASIIPGNEKTVSKIVNSFFKRGASVFYEGFEDMHVSGHASREELKLLLAMTRPKYFIPIHGELRHLIHHSNLAKLMGVKEKNVVIAEDGDVITVNDRGVNITDSVQAGSIYIDCRNDGDIKNSVLRERQRLATNGILIVVVTVSGKDGGIFEPEIDSRGFVFPHDSEVFISQVKSFVMKCVRNMTQKQKDTPHNMKSALADAIHTYFRKEIGIAPVVVPVIVEV
jgi:ribonuclease J